MEELQIPSLRSKSGVQHGDALVPAPTTHKLNTHLKKKTSSGAKLKNLSSAIVKTIKSLFSFLL